MVAVTPAAAAARHQQPAILPNHAKKKTKRTEKKEISDQAEISSILVSALQPSPTDSIPQSLSTNLSSSSTVLSLPPVKLRSSVVPSPIGTLTRSSSSSPSSLSRNHLNDCNVRFDDVFSDVDSLSMESDRIGGPQEKPCCRNDEEASSSTTTWPIDIEEIKWCKTNRGNERMCMGGHTYDLMSSSMKNNRRTCRCSKKDHGCRSVV
jgi:hypothetical protein